MTVRVMDVADYILEKKGILSAMKLQKLVYYSQAWHLVWLDTPLFEEEIQAWANGPVIVDLYERHKGNFQLSPGFFRGKPESISKDSKHAINKVIEFYGDKDAQWLSELTHFEDPWKNARVGLADGVRGTNPISLDSMMEYYAGL